MRSPDAPAEIRIDPHAAPTLDAGSPFGSLFEAKAALKYKPFALSPAARGKVRVLGVRRDELAWRSKLVAAHAEFAFLAGRDVTPEISHEVAPIRYTWERGRIA